MRFLQFCGFLLLAAVILAASAVTLPHLMHTPEQPKAAPAQTPTPEIKSDEPFHATIEYGTPEVLKHNNDPIHAYIRFPQGGFSTDEEISQWAQKVYDDFYIEFQSLLATEPSALGEINVHFDSYLVDNRYAGIFENGDFSYSLSIPPEVIVKTFNINLETDKFLGSDEILNYSLMSEIIAPLFYERMMIEHPQTEPHLAFIDESWLNHLVIGHEGIIVVLEKEKQLPDAFDTLTVTLPYDDLGSALLIRTEPPLAAPPIPAPLPGPAPDPSEDHDDVEGPVDPDNEPIDLDDTDDEDDPDDTDDEDDPDDTDGEDDPDDTDDEDDPDDTDDEDDPDDTDDEDDPDDGDDSDDTDDEEDPVDPDDHDGSTSDVPPQGDTFDPSKPVIALSFDDGPGVYTEKFVELFEKYNIRATFCTLGNLVLTQQDALEHAVRLGNEVIGHSWDHKNLAKLSADDVRKQLVDTSNVIERVTGTRVQKFRPPYGAISDTMKDVAADLGYAIIYWSVDPEDWNTKDSDAVYNAVMHQVKNGSIILSHEIYKSTLVAYERLIPELLSQGYQFLTVSELLQYKYGRLTPGHVYYDGYD